MLKILLLQNALAADGDTSGIQVSFRDEAAANSARYAAGDGVNVRGAPAVDAPVVARLGLGDPVRLGAAAGLQTVDGREDAWYEATVSGASGPIQGYVWGGALTAARFEADLDTDGEQEVYTVTYNQNHDILVRAREPGAPEGSAIAVLNRGQHNDIDGHLDTLYARLIPASETGVPLLKIYVPNREMCGSWDLELWVSYQTPGPGQVGTLREALTLSSGADAPVWSGEKAVWSPKKKLVVVTRENGELLENNDEEISREITRRVYRDGVFQTVQTKNEHEVKKAE